MANSIGTYLKQMQDVLCRISGSLIERNVGLLYEAWKGGRHVFLMGNGGSATTASHMANDLSKGTVVDGRPRMKAIALTDNVALLSAWANDSCYERVFVEQLTNLLDTGDVVLAISASGNSPNILRAVEFARQHGSVTVGWTGGSGGRLKDIVDLAVVVPSADVGMIESCHLVLDHLVTSELRRLIGAHGERRTATV